MRAIKSGVAVAIAAALLTSILGACHAAPCDPKNWLPSDCAKGETCDAHIRRCMPMTGCRTSADCFDGFACQDDRTCARNCQGGFFPSDWYCIQGWACNETSWACVRKPAI